MNIKQAKEQIKNAMIAYFTKDEDGEYMLPANQQRPVFLMGPPGIGKTAVMEQIASEMGVALLSYSMTHHTRQSALGLPYIVHKTYMGGEVECDVSEYTMSEIITSIYDLMESTGVREGILFLDEINCVSETLAPVMLQFLQYKIFGRHKVPDGWIVVTAGNPPEYNNSVREFDIVTWDRLKRIDVEPDFAVWKEYALGAGVHPAVLTFLEIKGGSFYKVQATVEGKNFVTARGWEDLSRMIRLYEKNGLKVDALLVGQYLQDAKIAREFAQYYDLFHKYRSDYQVDSILDGDASEEIRARAASAHFDERLSLLGLMMDTVRTETGAVMEQYEMTTRLMEVLKEFRGKLSKDSDTHQVYAELIRDKAAVMEAGKKAGSISAVELRVLRRLLAAMNRQLELLTDSMAAANALAALKKDFDAQVKKLKQAAVRTEKRMNNMFLFAEENYGDGQELLILAAEVTAGRTTSAFVGKFGCKEYFKHNQDLLLYEREHEIKSALKELHIG